MVRPILKNVLIKDNYASQPNKVTHFGLERLQGFLRNYYFSRKAKMEKERRSEGKRPSKEYLKGIGLEFNQKTQIFPLCHGIDFLGFHTYLTESGKVVRKLRRGSKNRMKKKIRKYASMLEKGEITPDEVEKSYKSWKAHASHGDCYYLIKKMDQYYNEKIVKEKSNGAKIK